MLTILFNIPAGDFIELQGKHSFWLVVLSIFIAIIASYAALTMNKQAQTNSFFHRNIWLSLGAIIMGFGIWAMHFIGMSAFLLPTAMEYDRLLTIISVIPAMLASFLAFYIVTLPKRTIRLYLVSGFIMGIGISSMHYIGMIAMKMEAIAVYHTGLFIASIGIAIVVSIIALSILSTLQDYMKKQGMRFLTSITLGLAVSSMHYTGMMAVTYYVTPDHTYMSTATESIRMSFIIISVTVGISILIALILFSSLIDRYIEYQTKYYDSLTRLPNRRLFEKRLNSTTSERSLAIWHLHNLENINRSHGYIFGDEVIQRASTIFRTLKPNSADLYRIEGNRFAFVINGVGGENVLRHAMRKISSSLRWPLNFQSQEILLSAVCAYQTAQKQTDIEQIYSDVLAVLNDPEIQFNHELIKYDPAIHTFTFEQEIASDVERAMLENELFLVYQPKIHGITYEVTGVETLLRWQHPKYGLLSPAIFIPILEASGQMLDVTDWIIKKASKQLADWHTNGVPMNKVAINIPGSYVTSSHLLDVLKDAVTTYELQPHCLELEITETSFVQDIDEAVKAVAILREEGFSVALDDFGTGVSSLSYLKRIPISTLKIDKSFVDGVPSSEKDSSIIQAIIAIASSLKLSIVFEGVETMEQADFLATTCDQPIIQGFCFAKPMTSKEFIKWHETFPQNLSIIN